MKYKRISISVLVIFSCIFLYLFSTSLFFSTYNDSGVYFQYPSNDWKLSDNNSSPLIISTKISGDRINVIKFEHQNSVEAYGTGATNELEQGELYVKESTYIGNLTNNKKNIVYRYYVTYTNIPNDFGGNLTTENIIYLFEKNGNAYVISGYFTVDPSLDNNTNINAMNTILETIK